MLGNGNMMSHFWGVSTWYNRYVSKDNPNQHLFDDEGNPLIDTDAGIQATEEHVRSLDWSDKGGLGWSWPEYYGNMANGNSFMLGTFSNCPKFLDNSETAIGGKMGSFLPPGHQFGNDLVRRSTIYLGNNGGVSTQSEYQEAAYLWLQWSGSTRIFSLLTGNPGGFFDPFQLANFQDPLVIQSYKPYHVPVIEGTVARAVPTIAIPGQFAMHNTLSENLVSALAGEITAQEAMENTAKSWRKHLRKKGEDKMIGLINAAKSRLVDGHRQGLIGPAPNRPEAGGVHRSRTARAGPCLGSPRGDERLAHGQRARECREPRGAPPADTMQRAYTSHLWRYALILVAVGIALLPVVWMATMAFKPHTEWVSTAGDLHWLPREPTFGNYEYVFTGETDAYSITHERTATKPILASLITSLLGTAIAVIAGTLGAYAVSRFAVGRNLPLGVLQLRLFPPLAVMIPVMIMWAFIGAMDSWWGLSLIYGIVTLPFAFWLMKTFFDEVPRERSRRPRSSRAAAGSACSGRSRCRW